jgi:streptogramin lyase
LLNNAYAEVVWVADRGTRELIKITSDDKKEVIELENFSNPVIVEVDQRDGSVWVTDLATTFNNQIVKLSKKGKELFRLKGFVRLGDAAIDKQDGSYFVSDRMIGEVIKISSEGKELFRIRNLSPIKDLEGMGCLREQEGCHLAYQGMVINLKGIDDVEISPYDSSIWVADTGNRRLLKFSKEGRKITQKGAIGEPEHLAIGKDGTCWVNNISRGRIFKISENGRKIVAKIEELELPFELSVSPLDDTCWVSAASELIQISSDGKKILRRIKGFKRPEGLSTINVIDGSFWVADSQIGEIIKISKEGDILERIGGFDNPRFLEVYWGKEYNNWHCKILCGCRAYVVLVNIREPAFVLRGERYMIKEKLQFLVQNILIV